MKIDTESILMDVRDITGIVQETIINLENYGSNDQHIKLPIALREAQMYLTDIKQRSKNVPLAEKTLECANKQFDFWAKENNSSMESTLKLESYLKARKIFNEKLEDLKSLTHRTFRDSSETEAFVTKNRKSFNKLKEKSVKINEESSDLENLVNLGIIAQSDSLMESLHDHIANLKIVNNDLIELQAPVEAYITEREIEYADLDETLVPKAEKYVDDLSQRSKKIVASFQTSKDGAKTAMLAATVHKNIIDAINSAREAADKAHEAAVFSNDKLNPVDQDEETMIEKGQELSSESGAIQKDAESQITAIKGIPCCAISRDKKTLKYFFSCCSFEGNAEPSTDHS